MTCTECHARDEICGLSDEENEESQETSENVEVKVRNNPLLPSQLEVDKHDASNHVPFRSWCKHCLMGRGMNAHHRKLKEEELEGVNTVSMDYGFMTTEADGDEEENTMPLLVSIDRHNKVISSHVVPKKGQDAYAIKRMGRI